MLTLKLNEENHLEMTFKDHMTGDFKHSEAFDLDDAKKIVQDILNTIKEEKKGKK